VRPSPPELLNAGHAIDQFSCGVPDLDDWLKRRALANQASGASRTYVACLDNRVIAFYAIASGAISAAGATGRFRRNMPEPIPVAVLGRLAVDASAQGLGLGRALFRDAALRLTAAADILGIRGMIVHALSPEAKAFYLALGLTESPGDAMTLMATLADLRAAL
jgi:GNAT superfamily N-acetyltransferase